MFQNALQQAIGLFQKIIGGGQPQARPMVSPINRAQQQLQILRKNTLDQTAYTPQAQTAIQKLPLNSYGGGQMSSWANQSGGVAGSGWAAINKNVLNSNQSSVPIFRHEAIHALDANVAQQSSARFPINSFGITNSMSTPQRAYISRKLNNSPQLYGEQTQSDPEGMAYLGMGSNRIVSDPHVGNFYKNLYLPMSKNINYSPVYPSPEYRYGFLRPKRGAHSVQ